LDTLPATISLYLEGRDEDVNESNEQGAEDLVMICVDRIDLSYNLIMTDRTNGSVLTGHNDGV
jgi:hypothetical protein